MYEQLRDELKVLLSHNLDPSELELTLHCVDSVMEKYEITRKSTELVVYDYNQVPELLNIYMSCKKIEGMSEQSIVNYGRALRNFFMYVHKAPADITTNDIRLYLYNYQQLRNISNRSLDKYRMYICTFFTWAFDNEYLPSNPTKKLPKIKFVPKPRESMSQIELEYIRGACKTLREKAIVEFLYSTGCRVSELCGATKADVNWAANPVTVHLFGKGQKHRNSYLNAKAEVALRTYLESRADNCDALFCTEKGEKHKLGKGQVEKIIKKIVARAELNTNKRISPHVFRHTTATTALNNGMPIEEIQALLGHSNIGTTMIYAHTNEEAVKMSHKHSVV